MKVGHQCLARSSHAPRPGPPADGQPFGDQRLADLASVGGIDEGQRTAVAVETVRLPGDAAAVADQLAQPLLGLQRDDELGLAARAETLGRVGTFEADLDAVETQACRRRR